MTDAGRERRDHLRDVLLAFARVERGHYPVPSSYEDQARRIAVSYAAATKKAWLRGMEEAARSIEMSIEAWSPDARRDFLDAVRQTTGREYAAICGGIEKAVAKLLRRKRRAFDEFDLRLLRDYVSDVPDGALVAQASAVLADVGGRIPGRAP